MRHFSVQKFKNQILGENQKIRSHFSGPTFIAKTLKKIRGLAQKMTEEIENEKKIFRKFQSEISSIF